jgi:hypothetical protein
MAAKATKKAVARKTSATKAKPKSAKNATAKKVSRARTTAKRAVNTATVSAKKVAAPAAAQTQAGMSLFTDQSEAMLKMGADAVRNMMAGAPDASGFFAGAKGAQLAQGADAANKSMNEVMSMGKDNIDAAVTCSSIAVNAGKNIGAELFNYANKSFSQNVEMSKEVFGCRTLNDMFDLQSKVMKTNMEHFINESVKMSEMMFRAASQVSEPINDRISDATKRISKTISDAA